MGTGRKKIAMEKIENVKNHRVTFTKRRQGLFSKLEKFQREFGCLVAAVVFSSAGNPFTFGDMKLLDRFEEENSSDVFLDGFGEFEQVDCVLKLGMNWDTGENDEAMRLGLDELESEVDECCEYYPLQILKNKLHELKEKKLSLIWNETESKVAEYSMRQSKMFGGYKEKKKLESMERSLKEITILCDVDAFLICTTKGDDGDFHTWPDDRSMVRELIGKHVAFGTKKSTRKKQVVPRTSVCEEYSSSSVLTKVELVRKIDSLANVVKEKLKLLNEPQECCKQGFFQFKILQRAPMDDDSPVNTSNSFDYMYSALG